MSTLDTRILEMRFENAGFEQNANRTLGTLDKLKSALNFDKSKESISELEKQANGFNMTGMGKAIDTVTARFDAMGVVAITTIANITNRAIAMGEQLVKSFTIDPIKMGMQEYETQINSVQTILANTQKEGTNIAQVNAALDELNHYADMTIYNFTEMTRNIGTFTAAGVKLDDSVAAIKGIANLAAVSGSNSEQASRAMYQLSQAMAAGTVKLQDWNSVVNAGMGGQVFQDALMETARVHGIAIDKMVTDEGSFRETLQRGWLTTEILTETLQKFTGDLSREELKALGYSQEQIDAIVKMGETANDAATKVKTFTQLIDTLQEAAQSGWTGAWRIIIGDFEEAKEVWTVASDELSAIINDQAQKRIDMLQNWSDRGGRQLGLMAIRNVFDSLVTVVGSLRTGFERVFEPLTGKKLYDVTLKITNLTERFKANEKTAYNLRHIARGLAAGFDLLLTPVKLVIDIFAKLLDVTLPAGDGIFAMAASLGDFIYEIDQTVKNSGIFEGLLEGITALIEPLGKGFQNATKFVSAFFQDFIQFDLTIFEAIASGLGDIAEGTSNFFQKIVDAYTPIHKWLVSKIDPIVEKFTQVKDAIVGAIEGISAADFIFAFTTVGVATFLQKAFGIIDEIKDFFKSQDPRGFLDSFKDIVGGVKDSLSSFQDTLKSEVLIKIAKAIAILAASLFVIALIPKDQLMSSIAAITALFVDMFASMAVFTKILASGEGIRGLVKMSAAFISLSVAITILGVALNIIARLDWDQLLRGLTGLAGSLAALVIASHLIDRHATIRMKRAAKALVIFSAAILVLSEAVARMGKLEWDQIGKGLVGVGVLCGELLIFLNLLNGSMTIRSSIALTMLAVGINVLAEAVGAFGRLNGAEIAKGLSTLAGVLAELGIFTIATSGTKSYLTTGASLLILAVAIEKLVGPLEQMGQMPIGNIGKSLLAMGGALAEITMALAFMPADTLLKSAGLIGLAYGLTILADALDSFGEMTWGEIAAGLVTLGGSLAILAVAMNAMTGTLAGAAAMIVMTEALKILLGVLQGYSEAGFAGLGEGILVIAAAMVTLGIASAALAPLAPAMITLAGAVALFGAAVAGIGIGVGLLAAGLGTLAVSLGTNGLAIITFLTGLANYIPEVIALMGQAFVNLITVIGDNAEAIGIAVEQILRVIINVLDNLVPELVESLLNFIETMLNTLAEHAPELVAAGWGFLTSLAQGLRESLGPSIESAIEIFGEFITKLIEGIGTMLGKIREVGSNIFTAIKDGMFSKKKDIVDTTDDAMEATKLKVQESNTPFEALGSDIISNLVNGFKKKDKEPLETINNILQKCLGEAKKTYEDWVETGKLFTAGIAKGIRDNKSEAINAAIEVARAALRAAQEELAIESPSKKATKLGMYTVEGFANGLLLYSSVAEDASRSMAKGTLEQISNAIKNSNKSGLGLDLDVNPVITPVLDLSQIESRKGELDAALRPKEISLATSRMASSITRAMGVVDAKRTDATSESESKPTEIIFNQNNYSPKALSRIEIYRQTRNQLSGLKGVIV